MPPHNRDPESLERLTLALTPCHPCLRGAPRGLPFRWDVASLVRGLNVTLTTDLGDIDLSGEIPGGGTYADLPPHSIVIEVFGIECRCLGLERLIHVKRAAGRPRDLEAIAELEAIGEKRSQEDTPS